MSYKSIIEQAITKFEFDISIEEATKLVEMDYEDGDINDVTIRDVVEILEASGIGWSDEDEEDVA